MIIRQIELKDNVDAAKIIRSVFVEFDAPRTGTVFSDPLTDILYQTFDIPQAVLWGAFLEDKLAGICGIFPTEGLPETCAELVKFYLATEARGKGIGKNLFNKSLESAKELGYKEIYIESLPQFSKAIGIYEKNGFTYLQKPMGTSGHTSCNIWMMKKL